MASCGCGRCECSLTPGDNIVITGSGDSGDPLVISGTQTTFAATSSDNTVAITPGGTYGHSPIINVAVSADGGNVLDVHGDGLYVGATALAVAARYIGELIDVSGSTTPGLTLETDGGEYAVASYPDLAGEYGASGIGDGLWDNHPQLGLPAAGNFRTPDLRRRSTYGHHTASGADIGDTDGITVASRTNTHSHTGPSHTHGISSGTTGITIGTSIPGRTETAADQVTGIDNPAIEDSAGLVDGGINLTKAGHDHAAPVNDGGHNHGGSTGAAGTGSTGNTTIPYAIVRKVVFAGV